MNVRCCEVGNLTSTLTLRIPSSNIISLISSVSISEQLKLTLSCFSGLLLDTADEDDEEEEEENMGNNLLLLCVTIHTYTLKFN